MSARQFASAPPASISLGTIGSLSKLSLVVVVSTRRGRGGQTLHTRCIMASPTRQFDSGGSGRSLTAATEHTMAFKWTKASRAKLSRSQKARWKERKRQQRQKRPKRPPHDAKIRCPIDPAQIRAWSFLDA